MSIIMEHFGNVLHEITNKPVAACKGLFQLAFKDVFGNDQMNNITYDQMHQIIQDGIKKRLEILKFPNIEEIMNKLLEDLKNNKPIFSLGSI